MLCPGFIDLHTHSALRSFDDPLLTPKLAQGFTTEVINPDGLAPAPVAPERRAERQAYLRPLEGGGPETWPWSTVEEYLDALDATRPALSLVPSIGHGAVRELVLGGGRVEPTAESLREMRREVRLGLEAGARMLSFGLVYLPGAYAATDELVAVAEEAAAFGVPLVPHVRNEGNGLLEAVAEMIDVARRVRRPAPRLAPQVARRREPDRAAARAARERRHRARRHVRPVPLRRRQHPAREHPARLGAGGRRGRHAADDRQPRRPAPHRAARSRTGCRAGRTSSARSGPSRSRSRTQRRRTRTPSAGRWRRSRAERGSDPVATALDLMSESALDVTMVLHYASDAAVRAIARHPLQLVGSDGIFGSRPHPRLYATAPRFLGRFAIQDGLLPVEEAVARLTARAADRLGLTDRGRIAVGKRADLVLLDPARYIDTATYADPARSPEGVAGVWVNGVAALRDGVPTGARPGGVVR